MMSLHPSKGIAVLQLCNCVSCGSVSSIKQLSDGVFLANTLCSTFPEYSKGTREENVTINCHDDKIDYVEEITDVTVQSQDANTGSENFDANTGSENFDANAGSENFDANAGSETFDVNAGSENFDANTGSENFDANTGSENFDSCEQNSVIKPADAVVDDKVVLQRFEYVQKFIDERYNIKSEEVISYSECMKSNELELAKVTSFVLSEVVKYFVFVNNDHLQTLSHLDIKVQEDLQECFSLFISERENISKKEVEKILCNHAKYKVPSPSKRSSFITPRRHCSSKYRRSISPVAPSYEETFTNSPLKTYFESPVFKKEDMILKDKEIERTRKTLHKEEERSDDLWCELKEAEKKLEEKDKVIKKLTDDIKKVKKQNQELMDCEYQNECRYCKDEKKSVEQTYKERMDFLTTEITSLHRKMHELRQTEENEKKQLMSELKEARQENSMHNSQHRRYENKEESAEEDFKKITRKNAKKSPSPKDSKSKWLLQKTEITNLKVNLNKVKKKLKDAEKNVLMYKEKLAFATLTRELESSVFGENMGDIMEEDRKLNNQKHQLIDQNQVCCDENSVNTTNPDLLDISNVLESEKLRNSVELSKDVKELNLINDEHMNVLNDSDVPSTQPGTSSQWDVNPCSKNTPKGILWKEYDSQSENENIFGTDYIDVDHDLYMPENIEKSDSVENTHHADCINANDLPMSENSDHAENVNADDLLMPENTDMLENPIFNKFLHSLGNILTNGSKQKVMQAVKKLLSASRINGSNEYNLQPIIDTITEYVSRQQDAMKGKTRTYSIQEEEIGKLEKKINDTLKEKNEKIDELKEKEKEIDNLKEKVKEIDNLKEKVKEIDNLKAEIKSMENKYEACFQEKCTVYRDKGKLRDHCTFLEERLSSLHKGYILVKEEMEKEKLLRKKVQNEYKVLERYKRGLMNKYNIEPSEQQQQRKSASLYKWKTKHEKRIKMLNEEKEELKQKLDKLTMKMKNQDSTVNAAEENKNISSETESAIPLGNVKKELPSINRNSKYVLTEFPSTSHDRNNESISSGALCSKSAFHLVSHDEESFLNQSSLADIKKDYKENRIEELRKRNSVLPLHLQSSYPVEALSLASENLYVKNDKKVKVRDLEERPNEYESSTKKQKLSDIKSEMQSTPITKMKRSFKTPTQLKSMFYNRIRRPGSIKPKP